MPPGLNVFFYPTGEPVHKRAPGEGGGGRECRAREGVRRRIEAGALHHFSSMHHRQPSGTGAIASLGWKARAFTKPLQTLGRRVLDILNWRGERTPSLKRLARRRNVRDDDGSAFCSVVCFFIVLFVRNKTGEGNALRKDQIAVKQGDRFGRFRWEFELGVAFELIQQGVGVYFNRCSYDNVN